MFWRQQPTGSQLARLDVQVCSQPCLIEEPFCQPLAQLALGINLSLITRDDGFASQPGAAATTECTGIGKGLLWENEGLGNLKTQSPASGKRCKTFSLTVQSHLRDLLASGRSMTLADICQQDVVVFDADKGKRTPKSFNGTGICM